ncbi:MAG: UDP-glucose 4-epimerase [Chlamydiales bacterium]|nr:UDP-glucose 4-epimerase [Chlamydiales bacterium]MCH9619482.1 UDP-glucose 4-epimerase [Chlamydiales bacterium]MCH9622286.1 UDP-glucose 4-epimerase [Chlamydiales bacterium]
MKTLVTGGAGFIGSHLVELLLEEGHQVTVVDNLKTGRFSNLEGLDIDFQEVDIRNVDLLEPLFEGVDWVFHLAGLADVIPSIENPKDYFEVNVQGTFNVLECARKANVKKLIYTASSSCYGLPVSVPTDESAAIAPQHPYAHSKYLGEELAMHWGKVYSLPVISLRLFNVYGPRSRTMGSYGAVFGIFLAQKLRGYPFTVVGDGEQSRDFVYVTDVANAFYTSAKSDLSYEIFNIGSSQNHSINALTELLEGDVVNIPKRPGEPDVSLADISKFQTMTGWSPKVSFKEGVAHLLSTLDDYRDAPLWEPEAIEKATENWFYHLEKQECALK